MLNSPAANRLRPAALALTAWALLTGGAALAVEPPPPFGAVPTPRQLAWEQDELYAFAHFGVNTFTGREWGEGDEKESLFNPTDFDADQIVAAVKAGGLKGLILTAKHHDGFCLWQSKVTEHSLKNSPWKGGKGDVVKELADACKRQGIKFGFYLSPWDRSHAEYAKPGYLDYYQSQLRELLTNYGPIFEIWLDGANGGSGYYGGAREERKVDPTTYYHWPTAWVTLMRQLQPGCVIHSDFGPDCRWGGNEGGSVGVPCWATLGNHDLTFTTTWESKRNSNGERPGDLWVPAESDVSIRPGWFYHAAEDGQVKGAHALMDLYFTTVGRGADLLLNIPPDTRGRIADPDVKALKEFADLRQRTFAKDLAKGAKATASNVRGNDKAFGGDHAIDGNADTYWCSDDGVTTPELVLDLPAAATFDIIDLRERIQLGQRIDAYAVDQWQGDKWVQCAGGSSVGSRALVRLPQPVTTTRVRLRITAAAACPAVSVLGLYLHAD